MPYNWRNELTAAISGRQSVTILLSDGETFHGVPESCTDRVKLRNDNGVVWVPVKDIEHVSRLIQLQRKKDPTST